MSSDLAVYLSLFTIAFLAASLLPAQSELVLSVLLATGHQPAWLLILAAWVGNTAGSALNWMLGLYITRFRDRPWFPVKAASLARAESWYHKYGRWSLLLSWAPLIGDPLTLAAGALREPLRFFLPLVAAAKLGRYLALAALVIYV